MITYQTYTSVLYNIYPFLNDPYFIQIGWTKRLCVSVISSWLYNK